jgi:hypothetical protein
MSKLLYKELRTKVPPHPLSPLKEIREKQELLFGLITPTLEPEPVLSLEPVLTPELEEETDTFSTPKSVFTLVDITEPHIEDDLALPPQAATQEPDLIEIDTLEAQLAENDATLKSQYTAIEYYRTQLEYYTNAINDYAIIFNHNQTAVDAQLKKLAELSEEITKKQDQLNSLNAQINAAMAAQLMTTIMSPLTSMVYT